MNFFKSVFADEPDPSNPESDSESGPTSNQDPDPKPQPSQPDPNPAGIGGWNFGDLIKTIATKSETVIDTYRRDLQEFGSGLKKEIEVAQGSLETVGTRIDELGNTVLAGTAQIISQGILAPDHESDSSDSNNTSTPQRSLNSNKYSRFESQVRAIQGDASTYCEEPEDLEEYRQWRSGFVLEEKREEIEGLLEGNGAMENIYNKVAPNVVDDETFWSRYYYRVYKLKQAEDVRANLVKRAISVELEEELSWDVDDDEYDESEGNVVAKSSLGKSSEVGAEDVKEKELKSDDQVGDKGSSKVGEVSSVAEEANVAAKTDSVEQKVVEEESSGEKLQSGTSEVVEEKEGKSLKVDNEKKESAVESSGDKESEKKKVNVEGDSGKKDLPPSKSDDKAALEVKNEAPASSKESGVSAPASVRPSVEPEEEDLGWDEIEDLSSIDEKKANPGASGASANRAELQKRLSTAEEEEDLSWDIEDDDDEPAKA
ncbi:putative BSD domain-containing protein [Rosa chinensis]|uniref:Putative BSD domain-containing protein n=1 Tax=Rosa chinensis TaxID=74649 RepID=A0A2P6PW85_ROSCH|nr:putative BSD domain-containing protein [Rosa chinensis]